MLTPSLGLDITARDDQRPHEVRLVCRLSRQCCRKLTMGGVPTHSLFPFASDAGPRIEARVRRNPFSLFPRGEPPTSLGALTSRVVCDSCRQPWAPGRDSRSRWASDHQLFPSALSFRKPAREKPLRFLDGCRLGLALRSVQPQYLLRYWEPAWLLAGTLGHRAPMSRVLARRLSCRGDSETEKAKRDLHRCHLTSSSPFSQSRDTIRSQTATPRRNGSTVSMTRNR